ncbi:hypothetical protein OG874_00285 [Nocardia sp. NBC_00565]|uniref:hypothetical protein n=1 Tax=Nocardia sp. NBC_00565 TaxID=2975993 RepID=UPI002E8072D2|nr:hypothetical protein [Nocardia sp. NBC_00565]WUC03692.1 hypothetical protein OG874_00285 [Nocardia sp. NBC_00565]
MTDNRPTDEQLTAWAEDAFDFPRYWQPEHDRYIESMAAELIAARAAVASQRPTLELPTLDGIQRYLTAHQWLPGKTGPVGTLWAKGDVRIGVPHELDEESVSGVLDRLAQAEQLDVGAVLAEIREQP